MEREKNKNSVIQPYHPNDEKSKSRPKSGLVFIKEHRQIAEYSMPGSVREDSASYDITKESEKRVPKRDKLKHPAK